MAIRATFTADISQFESAVKQAQSSLQGMQLRTDDVGKALARMTQQFDGSKIIREATLAAAAVDKVGGVTKLTTAEQQRLNRTVTEAIAKYEALGRQAPDDLRRIASATAQANQQTTMLGSAMGVAKTAMMGFVAGFTIERVVSGLVNATTETIAWAGSITDLSAKTGASVTALQRWEYAAKQGGNTLDQVTTSATELGRRLAEGEKSTVGALQVLNLSLGSLKQLRPEEQFNQVASAIAKIEDPGLQAAMAVDLLGKSGKDLLPTLKADLKALGDEAERLGAVVDEKTIAAMDDLGDTWQKLKDAGRGLIATVLEPMVPALNNIATAAANAAKMFRSDFWASAMKFSAVGGGGPMGLGAMFLQSYGTTAPAAGAAGGGSAAGPTLRASITTDEAFGGVLTKSKEYAQAMAGATRELIESAKYWREWYGQLRNQTNWAVKEIGITYGWADWARAQGGMTTVGNLGPGFSGMSTMTGAMGYGGFVPATAAGGFNWGGAGLAGLNAGLPWLSQLVTGGSQSAQVGGSIGGTGGGILGSLFSTSLGSVAPFLGPIMGLIGGLIGKLFGPSEGKQASQMRGDWITSLGGNDAFNQRLRDAQIAPDQAAALTNQLMSAKSREQVKAAQDAINTAIARNNALLTEQAAIEQQIATIEEQRKGLAESLVPTWAQLSSLIEQYGLTVEGLGTQVTQLGTTATFTTLINDMETLFRAGADVGGVLSGMADEISALVQRSIALGTEIPENMRPFIEELARSGQLLDENGQAITDLSTLKWGKPVETQAEIVTKAMDALDKTMADLVTRLEEIVDLLANKLPAAASTPMPTVTIPYEYKQQGEGLPNDGQDLWISGDIPQMASGGIVRRPTLALIGEAGPEAVVPLNRGGGVLSASPQVIQLTVSGRVLAEVLVDELGRQTRAVRR